jgi:NADP-dependent 3-hydroxy acid dehydrogenase YdfG
MSPLVYFVTGCSSGFGRAFVPEIVARGHKVIATARTLSKCETIKGPNVDLLELDVTWEPQRIALVIQNATKIHGRIDVLINNAGYAVPGIMEELS